GKCFECKETGHLARNCPTKNTVKSNGPKPPGAAAFNIEPVSKPENDWDDLVEILDSLPIGAVSFESSDENQNSSAPPETFQKWRDNYLYWDKTGVAARSMIGDCYAMLAESILTSEQPFPGDSAYEAPNLLPEWRFNIVRKDITDEYVIHDALTGDPITVTRSLLENPKFDISRWYATRRAQALNLKDRIIHRYAMGPAIDVVATKLLTDG
ncbi:hypothetical protein BYT27DRAFT_7050322, partial [Phlegmacium glaucopus]